MKKRTIVIAGFIGVGALGLLIWLLGNREQWGPEVSTDPAYRSGRESLCSTLPAEGELLAAKLEDLGIKALDRGVEHTVVHTFDAAQFAGGAINVCSEYGFVNLMK